MVSALQQQVFEILPFVKDCNSKAPFLLKFPHMPQAGWICLQCIDVAFCFTSLTVITWSYFKYLPLPLIANCFRSRARYVVFVVSQLLAQHHKQIIRKEHLSLCRPLSLSSSSDSNPIFFWEISLPPLSVPPCRWVLEMVYDLDLVRGTVIWICDLSGPYLRFWKDLERNPLNWGCWAVKP